MPTTAKLVADIDIVQSGSRVIEALWTIGTPIVDVQAIRLASGDNTITWPDGATLCIAVPPPTETVTITLKGVGGDTGIEVASAEAFVISKGTPASFIINAGALGVIAWQLHFI